MKKIILSLTLVLNFVLLADNVMYKNAGIVDIGRTVVTRTSEVPKEAIYRFPTTTSVPNEYVYTIREQSEKLRCEVDFLGTDTCPVSRETCPDEEEYTGSTSKANHIVKSFVQVCSTREIKVGTKCYLDDNRDGSPDNLMKTDNSYLLSNSGSSSPAGWGGLLGEYHISVGTYTFKFYAIEEDKYKIRIQADNYSTIKIDNYQKHSDTSDNWGEENPVYINLNKGEHTISIAAGNYGGKHGVAVAIYNSSDMLIWNTRSGQRVEYTDCKTGYTIEGNYCYTPASCPSDTTLQPDNSCKMEYDWYSYLCPTDTSIYSLPWQVIDSGSDCGAKSCTNSATPPVNNCVRPNYTCPIDAALKCGKVVIDEIICKDGYILKDNRCERISLYCDDLFYNAVTDTCQDITNYTKKCDSIEEVYNPITDRCETTKEACTTGTYDRALGKCVDAVNAKCLLLAGYTYNEITRKCENTAASPCLPQYNYDSTLAMCIGEMTVCLGGYTLNEVTNKCEKELCGILSTTDLSRRCETVSNCNGTMTSAGTCIPFSVVR